MLTDGESIIDPECFVEFYVDNDTKRLNQIFLDEFCPIEKNWYKYNDVVIIDSTYVLRLVNYVMIIPRTILIPTTPIMTIMTVSKFDIFDVRGFSLHKLILLLKKIPW